VLCLGNYNFTDIACERYGIELSDTVGGGLMNRSAFRSNRRRLPVEHSWDSREGGTG
jgi:hypothetical protein